MSLRESPGEEEEEEKKGRMKDEFLFSRRRLATARGAYIVIIYITLFVEDI